MVLSEIRLCTYVWHWALHTHARARSSRYVTLAQDHRTRGEATQAGRGVGADALP